MRYGVQLGIRGYGALGGLPEQDLPEALHRVRSAGFDAVEVMLPTLVASPNAHRVVEDGGLTCTGVHVFTHELDEAVALLRREHWGPDIPLIVSHDGEQEPGEEALRHISTAASTGDRPLLFHPHAPDFAIDGLYARIGSTMPETSFVIDVYWAAVAGVRASDAARHRCRYVHAKDGSLDGSRTTRLGEGDAQVEREIRAIAESGMVDVVVYERDRPHHDVDADLAFANRFIRDAVAAAA